jgi:hypothetical protein
MVLHKNLNKITKLQKKYSLHIFSHILIIFRLNLVRRITIYINLFIALKVIEI